MLALHSNEGTSAAFPRSALRSHTSNREIITNEEIGDGGRGSTSACEEHMGKCVRSLHEAAAGEGEKETRTP